MKAKLLFILLSTVLFSYQVGAQILDPTDPIVVYNPANPPSTPPYGQIKKWVVTPYLNWDASSYKAYFYKGIPFRLKFPKTYQPNVNDGKEYPLVIMLHGKGERGEIYDNEVSLKWGGQEQRNAVDNGKLDAFILYPQSQSGFWGATQFQAVSELVQYCISNVKVDPDRVVIHGLSAGGQAIWELISQPQYAKLFAAAIPMSAASPNYGESSDIASYIYLNLWLSQGDMDTNPTPFTSNNLVNKIEGQGGEIRYTLYENTGHNTWNKMYREPDFFPFIARAHKTDPHVFFGKTEFCPGENINVKLGFSKGFDGYEWRKNGVVIAGAQSNEVIVTTAGTYEGRFKRGNVWSQWSEHPVKIVVNQGTPPVTISVEGSTALPSLDGKSSVVLSAPDGYEAYAWSNGAKTQSITVSSAGTYTVSVTAPEGCPGPASEAVVVTTTTTRTTVGPTGFTASTVSPIQIDLVWNDNATNETAYELYRSTNQRSGYVLVTKLPANTNSYQDKGLAAGVQYYYQLRAISNSGGSEVATASGSTQGDTEAPTVPSNLKVVASTATSISLTWNASTDFVGVKEYEVFRGNTSVGTSTTTSYVAGNLAPGQVYTFKVRAKDASGNASGFSTTITGESIETGLTYKYYQGRWNVLPNFNAITPIATGSVSNVDISAKTQDDEFGFLFEGFIEIPVTGSYTFETNSDDGSKLYINPTSGAKAYDEQYMVVDNDGLHGGRYREGTINLTKGSHPIAIAFFEQGGGERLGVYWKNTAHGVVNRQLIPASAYRNPNPNVPPAFTVAPQEVSLKDNEVKDVTIRAEDANPGDIITFSATGLPSFATLTNLGGGQGQIRLSPGQGNVGSYEGIVLTATDNQGGSVSTPLKITVINGSLTIVNINFNDMLDEPSWNNLSSRSIAGAAIANLSDDKGGSTGISLKMLDQWGDGNANELGMTTGNNSGAVPDRVMQTAYWEGSSDTRRIELSGLSPDAKYNFAFFGSRNGGGNRSATYTIGTQSATLEAAYNTQNTAQINGIAVDASGKLLIEVKKASGSSYAYLNAIVIQSYKDNGLPLAATNLTANPTSKTQVALQWSDNSSDETGFEVRRSTAQNGTYSLVKTVAANTTSYTDQGLSSNTTYYYKVRAVNAKGTSDYSNVARVSTFQYTVSLNFNWYNPQAAPWNNTNVNPQQGDQFLNLKDDSGINRGVDVTIVEPFDGENPYGMNTGNNSGVVPDNVMRSTYWLDFGNSAKLKVSDLDQTKGYNFVFFASRNGAGNRTTEYTIGNQTVSLNAANNTSQTVQINNVRADGSGEVTIDIALAAGASYGYIGALIIQAYDLPANARTASGDLASASKESLTDGLNGDVVAYPNPFNDQLTIKGFESGEKVSVEIYGTTGSLVYSSTDHKTEAGKLTLDLATKNLRSGMYMVTVRSADGRTKVLRTIKE